MITKQILSHFVNVLTPIGEKDQYNVAVVIQNPTLEVNRNIMIRYLKSTPQVPTYEHHHSSQKIEIGVILPLLDIRPDSMILYDLHDECVGALENSQPFSDYGFIKWVQTRLITPQNGMMPLFQCACPPLAI